MRRFFLGALFLLSSLDSIANSLSDEYTFCFDVKADQGICDKSSELFDDCNSFLPDSDPTTWFQCVCTNGYVSTNDQCYWCQLAYETNPPYTDLKDNCINDNFAIAPIPASILSIESSFNASYTGVVPGDSNTAAATTADSAAPTTTTIRGGGISVPPKTKGPATSPSSTDDAAAASSTASDDSPNYTVTETAASSDSSSTATPKGSSSEDSPPVSKSSSRSGLSTGAKAGIAIGCILFAVLLGALVWIGVVLSRISKQKQQQAAQNFGPNVNQPVNLNQNQPGMAEMAGGFYVGENKPPATSPSVQNSTLSPASQGMNSSSGWPGGQTISPIPSPGHSPVPAPVVYQAYSPPQQQQQQQYPPPPQQQYPPPPVPQQQQYYASELQGSYVQVPSGAGMPPDGRAG